MANSNVIVYTSPATLSAPRVGIWATSGVVHVNEILFQEKKPSRAVKWNWTASVLGHEWVLYRLIKFFLKEKKDLLEQLNGTGLFLS